MELHHLRHFLAVADELHFGRAAKKLKMAQPPLSQSIMRLEDTLGTRLFDRSTRTVKLTPAGAALLPEAREIIARVTLAERLVERMGSGDLARLRIGFVSMTTAVALPQAIKTFRRAWPNVEVQLHERTSNAQVEALHAGDLDLGILSRERVDTRGLQIRPLERMGLVAAIPSHWPLAARNTLRIADLAGMPLLLFPQQVATEFYTPFVAACRTAGFVPRIAHRVGQPYMLLTLVSQELGIGLVPESARHIGIDGVTFVPIRELPPAMTQEVVLAWVPRATPAALRAMVALLEKASKRTG